MLSCQPRAALLLGVCLSFGCGQTTSEPSGGGNTAGGSSGGTSGAGASGGGAANVADNGVPIPIRDPRDTCEGLGLQITGCDPSGVCDTLGCVCPEATPLASRISCMGIGCVTAISCATYCAVGSSAEITAFFCASDGLCEGDAACPTGQHCVVPPNAKTGSCSAGQLGASCFTNADCASRACVITDGSGRGACDSGHLCNRAEHCASKTCVLAAGHYVGSCTDGKNGSPCLQNTQCASGLSCSPPIFASPSTGSLGACTDGFGASPCATSADCLPGFFCIESQHVCSAGGPGAACDKNSDCPGGFCSTLPGKGGCTSGEEGASCTDATQCKSSICFGLQCSSGQPGSRCASDSDCTGVCVLSQNQCTDGKLGQPCDGAQCEMGLSCVQRECSVP